MKELMEKLQKQAGITADQAGKVVETVKQYVTEKFPMLESAVQKVFQEGEEMASNLADKTAAAAGTTTADVKKNLSEKWEKLEDKVEDMAEDVKDRLEPYAEKAEEYAEKLKDKASGLFASIKEKVSDLVDGDDDAEKKTSQPGTDKMA